MYILMLFSIFYNDIKYLTMLAMFAAPIGGGHSNIPSSRRHQRNPNPIIEDLYSALCHQSKVHFLEFPV